MTATIKQPQDAEKKGKVPYKWIALSNTTLGVL